MPYNIRLPCCTTKQYGLNACEYGGDSSNYWLEWTPYDRRRKNYTYMVTLKCQGQNLNSRQGHVVTQVGHIAYDSMRLDERNTLRPLIRLNLFWIKVIEKTVGDLRWPQMTYWGVIDENWHLGHLWWSKETQFRVNVNMLMSKRASLNFTIDLTWLDHEIDMT